MTDTLYYQVMRVNTEAPALLTGDVDLALDCARGLSLVWDDGSMVKAYRAGKGATVNHRSVHFQAGQIVFVLDWDAWSDSGNSINAIASRSINEEW